jgi:hypothetical protein
MSKLQDRVIAAAGSRGELTLYKLDRATEITCARCAAHQTTRWIAVLSEDWRSLWCKSCYQAMPATPEEKG